MISFVNNDLRGYALQISLRPAKMVMTDSVNLYRVNIKEFAPEICAIVHWFR